MTQTWRLLALTALSYVVAGCCVFVPCDRLNHIGGYVRDSAGRPVSGANVTFYGVTHKTDAKGCFFFGGVLAASGFRVEVAKSNFKPYAGAKVFAFYELDVRLVTDSEEGESAATWNELNSEQIRTSPSCKGAW